MVKNRIYPEMLQFAGNLSYPVMKIKKCTLFGHFQKNAHSKISKFKTGIILVKGVSRNPAKVGLN